MQYVIAEEPKARESSQRNRIMGEHKYFLTLLPDQTASSLAAIEKLELLRLNVAAPTRLNVAAKEAAPR